MLSWPLLLTAGMSLGLAPSQPVLAGVPAPYALQPVGTFHGNEPIARDGEVWMPLRVHEGQAELVRTAVQVRPVRDDLVDEGGRVYQAGTLSGNPLAMAAGLALVKELRKPGFYEALEEKSAWFTAGLQQIAELAPFPTVLNRIGSMMTCFFAAGPVRDFESAMRADTGRYGQHYRQMLAGGVWLAPSQLEATFVSAAHDRAQLARALDMTESSFKKLADR